MAKKTVAHLLIQTLRNIGVQHVFGVPSGGWVDYMEAIRQTDGIEFVLTSHEGGASFMAAVCGQLTGVPGVCFGTFGPGATNLSTGVGCALLDRSPMIAFTDEMPEDMRGRTTQMGIDHQALFRPLTKQTNRLEPDRVQEMILQAAETALSELPGPVHVGLPVGMSAQFVSAVNTPELNPERPLIPSTESLSKAQELLRCSRKPVLAIGLGAVRARVQSKVLKLAEAGQLPIVLTPMAKGMVPESHPCYAGVLFHALSDQVGYIHHQSDLVIAIGYDPVEFNYESWLPKVPLISIDTVPTDLDRNQYNLACEVIGDISIATEKLSETITDNKEWDLQNLASWREKLFQKLNSNSNNFGPCHALEILRQVLPEEGIMVCDVGAHTHLIGQKWPTPQPGLQLMTNGWSSMGYGLPAAIAAKLCRPKLPVCAVLGDGGFLMSAGELATAVRENLHIVFVVLTDNDLALIRIKQQKKNNPIYGTPLQGPTTIGGNNIFGVPVYRASDPVQLETELQKAFQQKGPVIVETMIDSREYDSLILKSDKPNS